MRAQRSRHGGQGFAGEEGLPPVSPANRRQRVQRRVVLQPLDEAVCLVDQPFVLGRRQTVKQRLEQACPQGMRQLLPLLRPRLGEESLIATEQLVAAVAPRALP